MIPRHLIPILFLLIPPLPATAQTVVISEFSADSNRDLTGGGEPAEGTFPDEDGEFSDWIEIQNLTSEPQRLGDWALTDDATDLAKWQFPDVELPPHSYLIVFASGKDRGTAGGELHTNFRISAGGEHLALVEPDGVTVVGSFGNAFPPQDEGVSYGRGTLSLPMPAKFLADGADCRWLVPDAATPPDWNETTYDDAAWMAAKTAIGFESNADLVALIGEGGDVSDAMRAVNASIFARIPFEIVDPAAVTGMALQMQFDDGFVAYLNGELVASANAPLDPAWDETALQSRSGDDEHALETFTIDFQGKLAAGGNVLAIHGMNSSPGGSDLMLRPLLSGEIIDVNLPVETGYLESPTPGTPNAPLRYTGFAEKVRFSKARGFHTAPFMVELETDTPDAVIRYAINGATPAAEGQIYDGPIEVTTTTVIAATATRPGYRPSNVVSHTYVFLDDTILQPRAPEGYPSRWGARAPDYQMDPDIVGDAYTIEEVKESLLAFPSVAVTTHNDNLFDRKIGIYANSQARGDQWERLISVELFGFDHGEDFQTTGGLRMQGNASRNPNRMKHNMRIVFRQQYGPAKIHFRMFEGTEIETFNSINLRSNNGDSWINPGVRARGLYIRDQWHREVQRRMHQPNQPQDYANLYINGLYWGLYHTFERFEAPMLAQHFGGEPEDWDALQDTPAFQKIVIDGDDDAYREAHKLSRNADDPEVYRQLLELIDVDNIIDYLLINFYSANQDWDHKNMRYGRRREPVEGAIGNGFMFFAWDSERHGLNGLSSQSVTFDVTTRNTTLGPTFLNRNLLKNPDYKLRFADRVHKHLMHGGELTPEGVGKSWNDYADIVYPGLIGESARWGDLHVPSRPEVREGNWQRQMDRENETWIPRRTDILLTQLNRRNFYSKDSLYPELTPFGGMVAQDATVRIDVARLEQGTTFDGVIYYTLDGGDPRMPDGSPNPVAMTFDAENPPMIAHSRTMMSRLLDGEQWSPLSEAYYHIAELPSPGDLVISEINSGPAAANPAEQRAGVGGASEFEFLEVRNVSAKTLDLSGLQLSGGVEATVNPADLVTLAPDRVALIVADRDAFNTRYPGAPDTSIAAQFDGKLARAGERLTLRDHNGQLLVTLTYRKNLRWARLSDTGQTLEFAGGAGNHPENAALWRLSTEPGGTPGNAGSANNDLTSWLAARGLNDAAETIPVSGLSALIHYALGADDVKRGLRSKLPNIVATATGSATLQYERRADAGELEYLFEHSSDLRTWTSDTQPEQLSTAISDDGSERVTVRASVTTGTANYWRLAVRVK